MPVLRLPIRPARIAGVADTESPSGGIDFMTEEQVHIRTAGGTASGILYRADDGGQRPGVVYLTDIWGIRPAEEQRAKRIADAGYTVLMPNIFYRIGEPPFVKTPVDFSDPKIREKAAELS